MTNSTQTTVFEVCETSKGLYRVALYDAKTNRFLNRRRDVAKGRLEEIKATLLAEEGLA